MVSNIIVLGIILAGVVSFVITGLLRRYAQNAGLFDIPNARSSHKRPTPRGGGIAIVFVSMTSLILLWWHVAIPSYLLWSILGSGFVIALVGWLDDVGHVSVTWRLLVHSFVATWAMVWLGGLPPLNIMGTMLDFGLIGHFLAIIYVIWLLNLYNFMDGINGIAGIEAITVGLSVSLLLIFSPIDNQLWLLFLSLVAAVTGFTIWNFPDAKIFMGDVGSGFLGLIFGILTVYLAWVIPELFWCCLILFGVFIVDATLTLLKRLFRGDKVYQAHCTHAYQHAARKWGHTNVTLAVAAINVLWLFPMAILVTIYPDLDILIMLVAYAPLIYTSFKLEAGKPKSV